MKTAQEILEKVFSPSAQDCTTPKEDLQLAITLNPDLNKFLQAMEEYAAQPKWISVEERLPNELVEVMVYPEWNEIPVQAYLKNGVWKGSVETTEMMKDGYVNDREFIGIKITHWMPLPTPPEK